MHNIRYLVYHSRCSQKVVERELNNLAADEDREEGAVGLPNPIRWIDHICKSEDEAKAYIDSHDKGWYDSLAVKYKKGRAIYWLVKIEYHT